MTDINIKGSIVAKSGAKATLDCIETYFDAINKNDYEHKQMELHFAAIGYKDNDIIELRPIRLFKNEKGEIVETFVDTTNQKWWTIAEWLDEKNIAFLKKLNTQEKALHIFYGVNPRTKIGATGDDNVATCRCFFTDFDDLPADADITYLEKHIGDKGVPVPTSIVQSGHGFHAYWVLRHSIPVSEWRTPQAKLVKILGGCSRSKNPERMLRMPGFLNVKYAKTKKCFIEKISNDINAIYKPDFVKFLTELNVEDNSKETIRTKKKKDQFQWTLDFTKVDILKALSDRGKDYEDATKKNHKLACCAFPDFHGPKKEDRNASYSFAYTGEFAGYGHCFTCEVESKYTIIQLLLEHLGHDPFDRDAEMHLILELNDEYPGFLVSKTTFLYPGAPQKSRKVFLDTYFSEKSESGKNMITLLIVNGNPEGFNKKLGVWENLQPGYIEHLVDKLTETAKYKKVTVDRPSKKEKKEGKKETKKYSAVNFNADNKKISEIYKSVIRGRYYEIPKDIIMPYWLTPDPDPKNNPRPASDRMAIVAGGMLNLTNFDKITLRDVYPDLYNYARSPYFIDPEKPPEEPKEWFGWVKQWFDGDKDEMYEAQKRAGFFVFSSDVSFPIIWQLHGPGGAGKTQYVSAMRNARGAKNCLELSPYGLAELYGIADLPGKGLIIIDNPEWAACTNRALYSQRTNAISGKTLVEIRRMRLQPFTILSIAHILISADRPCPYPDPGGQRERRTYFSRMPNHWAFDDPTAYSDPDTNIDKKIEKMMPGIIWHYFIPGYINWLKDDKKDVGTVHLKSSDIIREDIQMASQPLKRFFIDILVQDKTKEKGWFTKTSVVWDNFRPWAETNGLVTNETKNSFKRSFVQKLYDDQKFFSKEFSLQFGITKEKLSSGDRKWAFLHILLKEDKRTK